MLIDKMATESLQDIGDEDISDVDEDDPDLLVSGGRRFIVICWNE